MPCQPVLTLLTPSSVNGSEGEDAAINGIAPAEHATTAASLLHIKNPSENVVLDRTQARCQIGFNADVPPVPPPAGPASDSELNEPRGGAPGADH